MADKYSLPVKIKIDKRINGSTFMETYRWTFSSSKISTWSIGAKLDTSRGIEVISTKTLKFEVFPNND